MRLVARFAGSAIQVWVLAHLAMPRLPQKVEVLVVVVEPGREVVPSEAGASTRARVLLLRTGSERAVMVVRRGRRERKR